MNSIEESVQLFEQGYVCSQAVFAAFCQDFGLEKDMALKIGACFGSGMRKGEVWGLKYGDDKSKSNEACERFLDEFENKNGSYICRDLLGCDIRTEEGVEYAVKHNLFKELCPKMVESASIILDEMLADD